MRHWAANIVRRHGAPALAAVRNRLGPLVPELPDDPPARGWWPIGTQLWLTHAMIEVMGRGDASIVRAMVVEDAIRHTSAATRLVIRHMGPARVLTQAPRLFGLAYDVGSLNVRVSEHSAELVYADSDAFAHPLWVHLHVTAVEVVLVLCGASLVGCDTALVSNAAGTTTSILVRWKE